MNTTHFAASGTQKNAGKYAMTWHLIRQGGECLLTAALASWQYGYRRAQFQLTPPIMNQYELI